MLQNKDYESYMIKPPYSHRPTVIVIGAGPASLLTLAQSQTVQVIVLERGHAVESRGKSIEELMHRRFLDF